MYRWVVLAALPGALPSDHSGSGRRDGPDRASAAGSSPARWPGGRECRSPRRTPAVPKSVEDVAARRPPSRSISSACSPCRPRGGLEEPRTQRNLVRGLHEGPPRTLRFQTRQPPLPAPDFQGLSAVLDVPDAVDRAGLDPGRQHPAVWAGPLTFDRLDKDRPERAGALRGEHNVALQIEQNRRGIARLRICNKGS